jgi:gas vesicle protein
MKKFVSLLLGFVVGAVAGSSVALLLAPASGEAMRKQIRDRINTVQNEVNEAARSKRVELEKQLADLRGPQK